MARDYRHGVQPKKAYQRKSQLNQTEEVTSEGLTGKQLSLLMVSLGLVMFAGYLVVSHFMHAGVRSEKLQPKNNSPVETIAPVSDALQKHKVLAVSEGSEVMPQKQPLAVESQVVKALPAPKVSEKVHYTFYQGLAKTEVVVNAEPLPVKLSQPYFIQAGSFGSEVIAKQEQARLKRLGFQTQVSPLKTNNRTYYRLRLGPFFDRLQMNKRRNQLQAVGVDTLLIKAKASKKHAFSAVSTTHAVPKNIEKQPSP